MRKILFTLCFSVILCTLSVHAFAAKGWQAAGVAPMDHDSTKILKAVVKEINGKTNNKFKLKARPDGQLGDYTSVLKKIAKGRIELGDISISTALDPKLAVAYIPSLVATYKDLDYVYVQGSNYYQIYEELLAKQNIKLLGFNVQGFVGAGMVKEPKSFKDMSVPKEALMRVPPIESYKLAAEAMNFETVTINWGELYPALKNGGCDGWLGGTPVWNYPFNDVLKYYIPYNILVDIQAYIMNLDKWNGLTPQEQQIFQDAFTIAAARGRKLLKESDTKYIKKMQEAGMKILPLTNDETRTIAQQVRTKVWPQMESLLGKDIMDRLNKDVEHLQR